MRRTIINTLAVLALMPIPVLVAGCVEDSPDDGPAGCTGETVTVGGEAYCVYQGNVVVEEGFRCPDGTPHLIEQGGVGICSPSEELTDERIGEIAEAYDRQIEPDNDGVDNPEECIAANPGQFEPDDVVDTYDASPPNNSSPDQTNETAADLQQECEGEGGTGCDLSGWITAEAAECIAANAGLEEGMEDWTTDILYNHRYLTVIWVVSNVLADDGAGTQSGRVAMIDATSGEVFGISIWQAQP